MKWAWRYCALLRLAKILTWSSWSRELRWSACVPYGRAYLVVLECVGAEVAHEMSPTLSWRPQIPRTNCARHSAPRYAAWRTALITSFPEDECEARAGASRYRGCSCDQAGSSSNCKAWRCRQNGGAALPASCLVVRDDHSS